MFSNLQKFKALSRKDKKLFLEAWWTLGLMRAAILTVSFKRLACGLQQHREEVLPPNVSSREEDEAVLVGRAIVRAANHTPWESACLVQALAAQKMLTRRNIAGVFYLGVKKKKTSLDAHAWTRCGNRIITGGPGHQEFTPVSAFAWQRRLA